MNHPRTPGTKRMANTSFRHQARLKRPLEQGSDVLSPREKQVIGALQAGMTERQAADALGLSPHTIHSHVKAVYHRMGVTSRAQLLSVWTAGK